MDNLEINTALQISRSREDVFEAIVEPEKMSNYFISESTGRMETGKKLKWRFPEFKAWFDIEVLETSKPESIRYIWEGAEGKDLTVEIKIEEISENKSLVSITEGKMKNDDAGIKWLGQNTAGWANFLACLKAYLEYDINLRKGGFDFMKEQA
ncbi:SRPBCC domain-containing protein [Gramella sp. GC03-9]|uniref:SRPBCC domain-containing protein n=1 Tax=Christiangramia oceanisediminis TaxID=2920386 RepID=A0A9X2I809_9FLAO|nr:SRPBCC domain-containing protein [Gramella oceanisediminis]MCP9198907.1 SRPBCC domain-containing protein [Gramella oceanisediminis]